MALNTYFGLRRLSLRALTACLFLPGLLAQSSGILSVAPAQKLVAKRNSSVEARILVQLRPGFHVNSNTPSEDYLIPLRLTWTPESLKPQDVVYPKPKMEQYEFSPKPISVFTGDFELVAKFQVPQDAPRGPGILIGKLRYQACNNKACFPPKTIEVRLPYQIQ